MPPRTRETQVPQKISPGGPRRQRTTSSEPNNTDRSPNLIMRGSLSDPLGQKKLGTRVSCLETQLIQAQKELKNLKQQLSSAEVAKKDDQSDLQKKNPSTNDQVEENHKEMDVFEVPMQESVEDHPLDSESRGIEELKGELEEKEKELESAMEEKEILKKQLCEASADISAAHIREEETTLKCTQLERDLEASKAAKEELELEMKKLRIQTEQWRKAADAAASVLAGGDVVRVSGRRGGSMDKHFNGVFEPPLANGYPGFLGSEAADDDLDDGYGGKVKGSVGIRMLGDLWKKKGQK